VTVEKVHISALLCGRCKHLKWDRERNAYSCVRNRKLPEYLPPYFAEKCPLYEPKRVPIWEE